MTEFLIQSGSGWRWKGAYPHYHILVKTTNGAQESLFAMSQDEMEMVRSIQFFVVLELMNISVY
jgi:hypothetical protein